MKLNLLPAISTVVLLSMAFPSCDNSAESPYINKIELETHQYEITEDLTRFTLAIMQSVDSNNPEGSWMFSPFGVASSLALINNFADEEASKEIKEVLGLSDWTTEEINGYFSVMIDGLSQYGVGSTLKMGSYLSMPNSQSLDPSRLKTLTESYNLSDHSFAGGDSDALLSSINEWSKEKISGKLSSPVRRTDLISDGGVVFSSGFSYEGKWRYRFDPKETTKQMFLKQDRTLVEVDMMKRSYVKPYPNVFIPVAGDEFGQLGKGTYMFSVYYPGKADAGVDPLFKNFQEFMDVALSEGGEDWYPILFGGHNISEIEYWIPKFQTASKAIDMKTSLKDIGVGKIFSDGITLSGGAKTNIGSFLDVGYFRTAEDGYGSLDGYDGMYTYRFISKDLFKADSTFYYFLYLPSPGIFLMAGKYDGD